MSHSAILPARAALLALCILLGTVGSATVRAQSRVPYLDRIFVDGEPLFLSGGNVPWIHFARDVGPGPTPLSEFETRFHRVAEHGGNSMRLWLHVNGVHTPAWGPDSMVVGPGKETIRDLRAILDAAWRHEIGLILCLWSFDMLREEGVDWPIDRNELLLRDPEHTQSYIENALVPIVEAVGDHPAVVAWEVVNEPEGMSHRFGWSFTRHVSMETIQGFVNRVAGAIRRTDPDALVTSGAWSFITLSDRASAARKNGARTETLSQADVAEIQRTLSRRYRHDITRTEARAAYKRIRSASEARSYYRNARLVSAGGDPMGILDFYSVHYYDWAGRWLSPFHVDATYWGLDKPVAVTEFAMKDLLGVSHSSLYSTLFRRGYAGAHGWSFNDALAAGRMEENMLEMHDRYPAAVDLDSARVDPSIRPGQVALYPPSPNPVEARAVVVYDVPRPAHVHLDVYDAMGRRITSLVDRPQTNARHRVRVNTRNLSSGLYLLRLRVGAVVRAARMIVVK